MKINLNTNRTQSVGYSLGIQGSKTPSVINQKHREGHTDRNHTINLALDAPVNEETKNFNLLETEQKSHSDTGLIALESKKLMVQTHQILDIRQVEKVILI